MIPFGYSLILTAQVASLQAFPKSLKTGEHVI
jgi:hypothetical protein